jgi:hypothetical protein
MNLDRPYDCFPQIVEYYPLFYRLLDAIGPNEHVIRYIDD